MQDYYLILGLDLDAADSAIDDAYYYLNRNLNPVNFPAGSDTEQQAEKCMSRVVPAYKMLKDRTTREPARKEIEEERSKGFKPEEFKPWLGHLCVAAGIITIDDLDDAISRQTDIDLPLGQILQEKALLSQTELDGLLMGQRLFGNPNKPIEDIVRRLLVLNAITVDMIKIAIIDQRTSMKTLIELLIQRGWASEAIVRILESQKDAVRP